MHKGDLESLSSSAADCGGGEGSPDGPVALLSELDLVLSF